MFLPPLTRFTVERSDHFAHGVPVTPLDVNHVHLEHQRMNLDTMLADLHRQHSPIVIRDREHRSILRSSQSARPVRTVQFRRLVSALLVSLGERVAPREVADPAYHA